MPTLTIDIPEAEYRVALALPESERRQRVVNAFATARNIPSEEPDYDRGTNEADLEAIGNGIQAFAEGQVIPGDVAFARLRDQFKQPAQAATEK